MMYAPVERLRWHVDGIPVPQGSKTAFRNKYSGKLMVVDSAHNLGPWRAEVTRIAKAEWPFDVVHEKPIAIGLIFYLPRPKAHYGTGKNADRLKPGAPTEHALKPDVDKLARAILDSLTGVVYFDDSQVYDLRCRKLYSDTLTGVAIEVMW